MRVTTAVRPDRREEVPVQGRVAPGQVRVAATVPEVAVAVRVQAPDLVALREPRRAPR